MRFTITKHDKYNQNFIDKCFCLKQNFNSYFNDKSLDFLFDESFLKSNNQSENYLGVLPSLSDYLSFPIYEKFDNNGLIYLNFGLKPNKWHFIDSNSDLITSNKQLIYYLYARKILENDLDQLKKATWLKFHIDEDIFQSIKDLYKLYNLREFI